MMIIQSASKIVFVLITVGIIALTFAGKLDPKDFMILASMSYSYYFTQKKSTN